MALQGRPPCGQPTPPVRIRKAAMAYWTPADLGFEETELSAVKIESPILFVAGLNSFMVLMQYFTPSGIITWNLTIYDPITQAPLLVRQLITVFAGGVGQSVLTFGAFGTSVSPAFPSPSRGDVWWLLSIGFVVDGAVGQVFITAHLLGGIR